MALKHADVPVVVAPAGLALGGGCEIALHADRVHAAAETYIGLVEVGVGLIPAGGGCKELLGRTMEATPAGADPLPVVQRLFETIGFAKVSTSGPDAMRLGYLRSVDGISMNRDRLLADAKAAALARALSAVTIRFDNLWRTSFPYVMVLHQAPTDGGATDPGGGGGGAFHFFIAFHPPLRQPHLLKYLAGPEIGGGNFLSDTSPEASAAELRALPAAHHAAR